MEVEKERGERRKVRKRTKAAGGTTSSSAAAAGRSGDVEMSDVTITTAAATTASNDEETTSKEDKGKGPVLGGDLEDEGIYRAREAAEFDALVDPSLKNDLGCSTTGLYELVGLYLFFFSIISAFFYNPAFYQFILQY